MDGIWRLMWLKIQTRMGRRGVRKEPGEIEDGNREQRGNLYVLCCALQGSCIGTRLIPDHARDTREALFNKD